MALKFILKLEIQIIISKYRLSLAEKFDCRETLINELVADSYQNPISKWQVTIKLYLVGRLYSGNWVDVLQLYICIWWQANDDSDLKSDPTMILVHAWPSHYSVCHFSLCLFPALHTCLSHSIGKSKSCVSVLVTQSFPTLCNPMDCSPPGSSVHGIFQARMLEWVTISFSYINLPTVGRWSGWWKGIWKARSQTRFSWQ